MSVKPAASWSLAFPKHFVFERAEVSGGWRQLHNALRHNSYSPSDIASMIE
jgi:hypothetical protein